MNKENAKTFAIIFLFCFAIATWVFGFPPY